MQQKENRTPYRPQKITKLLVANRGEIAVRVMRTCKELGIETVAVYSEADRNALHVQLADEAYCIGPAPSRSSYLLEDKILEVALAARANAIHPGYGFLSENAAFSLACRREKIIFVGPPPDAIRAMGDKTTARAMMEKAAIPMAPGTTEAVADVEEAARIAVDIGYPVLIKAAAGGGGKGMRLVEDPADFTQAMEMAQREAEAAFGDGRVFLEKYIVQPRHIEFQVLADEHGHCIHLFERDCSIQRRHQKVIEEAPSSILTREVREMMGQAAINAALACGYTNAGTVEFLVDKDLNFYFMEMNTRLQVEHPVTEMITGLDLVAEQLRVAEGMPLELGQDDVQMQGHAIECRVYAEDPENNFLPSPGPLTVHRPPAGLGVRLDAGVEEGGEIPIHYDPMIAKLVTYAGTRAEAICKMARALDEYEVAGVKTTIPFCAFVMGHEAFLKGDVSTHFVGNYFTPEVLQQSTENEQLAAALAAAWHVHQQKPEKPAAEQVAITSPWRQRKVH
ncbi:MAG: acetyl-CoA carboxylase biotin carboxylase subunit [Bacteroidota bacterium]